MKKDRNLFSTSIWELTIYSYSTEISSETKSNYEQNILNKLTDFFRIKLNLLPKNIVHVYFRVRRENLFKVKYMIISYIRFFKNSFQKSTSFFKCSLFCNLESLSWLEFWNMHLINSTLRNIDKIHKPVWLRYFCALCMCEV